RPAQPDGDSRLAWLRSSGSGARGRYLAQHAGAGTMRTAARRRPGASSFPRPRRAPRRDPGRFGLALHWSDGVMGILSGIRVVEGSAFVAAPPRGLTFAQLGA